MTKKILLALALGLTTASVRADVSDSGNLTIGGQAVIVGSMTVTGAIAGSSVTLSTTGAAVYALTISTGIHVLNGRVKLEAGSFIEWPDGTMSISSTTGGGGTGAASSSTYVRLCGGDQTPTGGQNTQGTAATVTNSTASMHFSAGSWAEVAITLFHVADGTQYNVDLYVDNVRPSWVGSNGIMTCQGSASSIYGSCAGVFPIDVSTNTNAFYLKVWRGGNPVTLKMSNPCSYYTVKEMRVN